VVDNGYRAGEFRQSLPAVSGFGRAKSSGPVVVSEGRAGSDPLVQATVVVPSRITQPGTVSGNYMCPPEGTHLRTKKSCSLATRH
jgi:hypothetical protein